MNALGYITRVYVYIYRRKRISEAIAHAKDRPNDQTTNRPTERTGNYPAIGVHTRSTMSASRIAQEVELVCAIFGPEGLGFLTPSIEDFSNRLVASLLRHAPSKPTGATKRRENRFAPRRRSCCVFVDVNETALPLFLISFDLTPAPFRKASPLLFSHTTINSKPCLGQYLFIINYTYSFTPNLLFMYTHWIG